MKIAIAADHGGYQLKSFLKKKLIEKYDVIDFGSDSEERVDYPDYIQKAAMEVSQKRCDHGIVICYSGIGASIVANKFRNVRAALCFNIEMARSSKEHNNANVLALGSKYVGLELAFEIFEVWMSSEFLFGRHQDRIDKIHKIESILNLK